MTASPRIVAGLFTIALVGALAAGCTRAVVAPVASPSTPSIEASSSGAQTVEATTSAPLGTQASGGSGSSSSTPSKGGKTGKGSTSTVGGSKTSGVDLESVDAQLQAMQRELDGLSVPSDSDFNGAAGAVY